ncbi:hypothetical protein MXD81_56290 [Microbacteriaceae bacterium K1510]|nr:hypothetical protein [Microbacteriaceae bacterium K1510]
MAGRLKVKFLTAIWGARYIKEFARVSLPSYLAAGNLPYLASETDLEIVILTSRASIPQFDAEPIFAKIKALCPLRYIFIDDLITTGNYGVTLTLAYARGIMDSGAEQTNTHFVFMNSDFVLADGSFRTLYAKLRDGHGCIMAPSLRASAEATLPTLIEAVDQASQTLSMPPRRMVQLAFDNLHPTVIAKTVTQNFVTFATHNQIYWQADSTTLLARYYLIFMLAIKPERPLPPINSYCDYGFVPELVPSGRLSILDDSDGFFMLELQPSVQESEFLHCGRSNPREIAERLAMWTTREHRRFAEVDVVFHSKALPPDFDQRRQEAAKYISTLSKLMPNSPIDHVDHRYWRLGVQSWALLKFAGAPDPTQLPAEISATKTAAVPARKSRTMKSLWQRTRTKLLDHYLTLVNRMRIAAGIIPNVPLWNHLWTDSKLILDWVEAVKWQPRKNNLLISKTTSPLAATLPKLAPFDTCIDPDAFVAYVEESRSDQRDGNTKRFDNIFFHLRRADLQHSHKIIDLAEHCLAPGGRGMSRVLLNF